jgi:aspartate racemase
MQEDNAIGVIGGLGPYAGIDLVRKIFDSTQASRDQDHLPVVLISFPGRIPDRSAYIADAAAPNPVPALTEILRRLDTAGCAVAGMPCNTAHAPVIFEPMAEAMEREGRRVRLINMIDACAESIAEHHPAVRAVGILGTSATLGQRLYDRALERVGLEPVRPADDFQASTVNPVIFDPEWGIKACGNPPTERARRQLIEGVRHLKARGADAVILGCTELPLALPEPEIEGVPLIDSTLALARTLIARTFPDRLRRPAEPALAAQG